MGNRAITVNYVPHGDDWKITVTEGDATQTGTAAGLIAARDTADQLVEKIDPDQVGRHVVHLLDGDAFGFTAAYLHARHGLSMANQDAADAPEQPTARNDAEPATPAAEKTVPETRSLDELVSSSSVLTVPGNSVITLPPGAVRLAEPVAQVAQVAAVAEPEQHPV